MGLPPKNLYNALKIWQFCRFGLHPWELATLRATLGLMILMLLHKTYQNQGICYITIPYCYVTRMLLARNKFPCVKGARNTKKGGQACFRS